MTYRTLFVVLDHSGACADRVQFAIGLARDHKAHLTGLAPTGEIGIPPATEASVPLADSAALAWDTLRDRAEDAAERFRSACRAASLDSFESIVDEAAPADAVLRHAACHDLAILSSDGKPSTSDQQRSRELAEVVILRSPRPTLVIPRAAEVKPVGGRVLVAWDDSREATRALGDALPVLRMARRVELVRWRESPGDPGAMDQARLDAMHRWLAHHDVMSHGYLETAEEGVPQAIHSRALQMDADLVVMGAYGHRRWAEKLLGGRDAWRSGHDDDASVDVPLIGRKYEAQLERTTPRGLCAFRA